MTEKKETIITEEFLRDAPIGTTLEQDGHKYEKMSNGKWARLTLSYHYEDNSDGTRNCVLDHFDPR